MRISIITGTLLWCGTIGVAAEPRDRAPERTAPHWRVELPAGAQTMAFEVMDDVLLAVSGQEVAALAADTGAIQWRSPCHPVNADPALVLRASGGRLFVREDHGVRCLDRRDGHALWSVTTIPATQPEYQTLAMSVADGSVVVLSEFQKPLPPGYSELIAGLRCVDAENGRERWSSDGFGQAVIPTDIDLGARVACVALDHDLIGLDARSGAKRWTRAARPPLDGAITMRSGADRCLCAGATRGVLAIDDDGGERWRDEGTLVPSLDRHPAPLGDRVFLDDGHGHLRCVGLADGRGRWATELPAPTQIASVRAQILGDVAIVAVTYDQPRSAKFTEAGPTPAPPRPAPHLLGFDVGTGALAWDAAWENCGFTVAGSRLCAPSEVNGACVIVIDPRTGRSSRTDPDATVAGTFVALGADAYFVATPPPDAGDPDRVQFLSRIDLPPAR